jgi:hypothetical protein
MPQPAIWTADRLGVGLVIRTEEMWEAVGGGPAAGGGAWHLGRRPLRPGVRGPLAPAGGVAAAVQPHGPLGACRDPRRRSRPSPGIPKQPAAALAGHRSVPDRFCNTLGCRRPSSWGSGRRPARSPRRSGRAPGRAGRLGCRRRCRRRRAGASLRWAGRQRAGRAPARRAVPAPAGRGRRGSPGPACGHVIVDVDGGRLDGGRKQSSRSSLVDIDSQCKYELGWGVPTGRVTSGSRDATIGPRTGGLVEWWFPQRSGPWGGG